MIDTVGLIPIPNLSLLLQANLGGILRIGADIKAQSILIASLAYPAALDRDILNVIFCTGWLNSSTH